MALERIPSSLYIEMPDVKSPDNACVWTSKQFCTMMGWHAFSESEHGLALRRTRFADKRIIFLELVEGHQVPPEFVGFVSGQYDVKSWRKNDCVVSLDGETTVLMKFPGIQEIITFTPPSRLPTFPRSWMPVVCRCNAAVITVRLTMNTVIVIVRETPSAVNSAFNVLPVDYNNGFACIHPCSNTFLTYGSYNAAPSLVALAYVKLPSNNINSNDDIRTSVVTSTFNIGPAAAACVIPLPKLGKPSVCTPWQHVVQFYTWGCLVIPKKVLLSKPKFVGFCVDFSNPKKGQIALGILPPNIYFYIRLCVPQGVSRKLVLGDDFGITIKKITESEVVIYLLLDGQLATREYSFDTRINKDGKPKINVPICFKVHPRKGDKSTNPKFLVAQANDVKVRMGSGSPICNFDYLISEQVVGAFDAESGEYLTNPVGAKLTTVFKQLQVTESDGDSCTPTSNNHNVNNVSENDMVNNKSGDQAESCCNLSGDEEDVK